MQTQVETIDFKGVVRRQKTIFIITFLGILLASVIVAYTLPPVYISRAKILIEGQQIPENYVQSNITSYVEERIQMISQQVMSWPKLKALVEKVDLYPEIRKTRSMGEVISMLRENINLRRVSSRTVDKRTGRAREVVVAFELSFEGQDPESVQKVTNELAYLYISEELKNKEKLVSVTTDFLSAELEKFKHRINEYEGQVSEYKRAHIGALPENYLSNIQKLERLEREFDRNESRLRSLQGKLIFLKVQLSNVDPLKPVIVDGQNLMLNPIERLKRLRLELASVQTTLSDKHPDIKKMKREIAELEAKVGKSDDTTEKMKQLKELEGQLAAMKGKWGAKHPNVVKLSRTVEALREEVSRLSTRKAETMPEPKPDNPVYINLMTQIAALQLDVKALREDQRKLKSEISGYQDLIDNAPIVEKKYKELTRDLQGAQQKYNELSHKLMSAKVSQGMEEAQRGERFTITDPAYLPEKPYKPNRLLIVVFGFILAFGAAVGVSTMREYSDNSIKTMQEIKEITGAPVFSAFPVVTGHKNKNFGRAAQMMVLLSIVCTVIVVWVVLDRYMLPLESLLPSLRLN